MPICVSTYVLVAASCARVGSDNEVILLELRDRFPLGAVMLFKATVC